MTPAAAAAELSWRRGIRLDLAEFCEHALEHLGYKPAAHHLLLIQELEDIAFGRNDRLLVTMPPGHGKSIYVSVLFPAWFLSHNPHRNVIAASNTAELAEDFSRRVMGVIREHSEPLGYGLVRENASLWETTNDCRYRAAGVGGTVTGYRSDIGIIDDPIRGAEDADSRRIREKVYNWYRSDFLTRLKPGGRIVLVQTRWSFDDLAGRILRDEREQWRTLNLPALAELSDELGREPGQALWPEWENEEALVRRRRSLGERAFSALYQQKPTADEGAILKADWWKPWTEPLPSKPDFIVVSVDTAYTTKEQNCYSACTVWYMLSPELVARPGAAFDPDQFRARILLRGGWQERLEFPELVEKLLMTAEAAAAPGVPMRVLVEGKANGISVIQELRRRVPKLNVWQTNPKGDKVARAHSVTSLLEGGKVWALATKYDDGPRFKPFAQQTIDECAQFPLGQHDDLADSVTQGLRHMRDSGAEYFPEDSVPDADDAYESLLLY